MDDDNEYELSDSDEYEESDKILLDDFKKSSKKAYDDDEDEVYGVGSDDDVEGGGEDLSDVDMGSDIEDRDDDRLPDDRAWGQRRKNFYSTDYVDQDYAGALGAEEDEAAKMEEQEAKNIQKRLMEQLNDADFSLVDIAETTFSTTESKAEMIQTDLSQLSKRQKLDLFKKEAPEFSNLVDDFLVKLTDAKERIVPVLNLVKEGKLAQSSATKFLETKFRLILNYCTNIAFYILLKTKRIPVKDHPVLKCLFRYRQLLNQLQSVNDSIIAPQVEKILEVFNTKETAEDNSDVKGVKGKKLLKILKSVETQKLKDADKNTVDEESPPFDEPLVASSIDVDLDVLEDAEELEGDVDKQGKRAITYEMAKNKGLTPKRSKEQRNPRVKHRNKFRKAKIRRRGQIRTPRTEIPVYGGEPTGIKIGVKKGRKLI